MAKSRAMCHARISDSGIGDSQDPTPLAVVTWPVAELEVKPKVELAGSIMALSNTGGWQQVGAKK